MLVSTDCKGFEGIYDLAIIKIDGERLVGFALSNRFEALTLKSYKAKEEAIEELKKIRVWAAKGAEGLYEIR